MNKSLVVASAAEVISLTPRAIASSGAWTGVATASIIGSGAEAGATIPGINTNGPLEDALQFGFR